MLPTIPTNLYCVLDRANSCAPVPGDRDRIPLFILRAPNWCLRQEADSRAHALSNRRLRCDATGQILVAAMDIFLQSFPRYARHDVRLEILSYGQR